MSASTRSLPWIVKGKATPFSQPRPISAPQPTLEDALKEAERLKAVGRFYRTWVVAR